LRQDPKAYPRTPKQDQGAELATAVLRYVLDEQEWKAISPECGRDAAIDGIGGIQIEIEQGDHGDPEVGLLLVEPDSFFYDPRSYKPDFSDARYMGEGKWLDMDTAVDMFPNKADQIRSVGTADSDLSSNPDREQKWFSIDGSKRLVRMVDCWYQHNGKWCWMMFTGSTVLMEGESYLINEKNKTICKYIMFSCNVDHDGDRYGFVRNMKSVQDSLNFKHSKMNHILASKRLILTQGAVTDIEKTRSEWARSDGVIVVPSNNVNEAVKADDQSFDFAGWFKLLEEDKSELDNFGPNQALIGDIQNQSGRAIQLLQQAGMAELGPYILGYRNWKLRVYRAIFSAVQKYWTGERWVRVTDDDGLAQFIQLNGTGQDPQTGQSTLVNALGALDVDIILDEGPDTINAQQDVYETLSNVLPTVGPMLNPLEARAAVGVLLESSALPASAKKKFREASEQASQQPQPPNPEIEKTKIQLEAKQQETAIQLQAKQQENAANLVAKQQESEAQLEADQRKAAADMMLKNRQHEQDLAFKREQAALDRQVERERMEDQSRHELMKLAHGVQAKREEQALKRQADSDEAEGKSDENDDDSVKLLAESVSELAQGAVKGMGQMADSIEEMAEKIAAPKEIIRDKAGNIIGAQSVEKV
jgi:hypothetical protein